MWEKVTALIKQNGGDVRTGAWVKRVLRKGNRVTGVEVCQTDPATNQTNTFIQEGTDFINTMSQIAFSVGDAETPATSLELTAASSNPALLKAGMDVTAAVGAGAAVEFGAFRQLYEQVPDLEAIMAGNGAGQDFPDEPSVRYATVVGMTARSKDAAHAFNAFKWLTQNAGAEWVQLCAVDLFRQMGLKGHMRALRRMLDNDADVQRWLTEYGDALNRNGEFGEAASATARNGQQPPVGNGHHETAAAA